MVILTDLSTELLINICKYLNLSDLYHLTCSCRRLNEVIRIWGHVIVENLIPVATNQLDERMVKRLNYRMDKLKQLRISRNWLLGRYKELTLLKNQVRYIPWMVLERNFLWFSRGHTILRLHRNGSHIRRKDLLVIAGSSHEDVTRFTVKNDLLCTGQADGRIWMWSNQDQCLLFEQEHCHNSDIQSVDFTSFASLIVSGCRDNSVKIWANTSSLQEIHCTYLQDRIWTVNINEDEPLVALGTSSNKSTVGLSIFDLQTFTEVSKFVDGRYKGVLDCKWENNNILWTCGYSCALKKWDLRTGCCEQIIEDPHDVVIYCMDFDYFNTVVGGCQRFGRIALFDVRKSRCLQLYFMQCSRGQSRCKPVYSVAFDGPNLFAATDTHLSVFDFSITGNSQGKNYSNFLNFL